MLVSDSHRLRGNETVRRDMNEWKIREEWATDWDKLATDRDKWTNHREKWATDRGRNGNVGLTARPATPHRKTAEKC